MSPLEGVETMNGQNGTHIGSEGEAPKRRGRPPGAKNKTTATATAVEAAPKRRGRPPGIKNKASTTTSETPKRRGRPPGAKNKAAALTAAFRPASEANVPGDGGPSALPKPDSLPAHYLMEVATYLRQLKAALADFDK